MLITISDLCERLRRIDEVTLMELLHIRSDDIVDRFEDIIIRKSFELKEQLREEGDDSLDEDVENDNISC